MNEKINANNKESKLTVEESVCFTTQMKYGYIETGELNIQIAAEAFHLESEALYTTENFLKGKDKQ